MVKKAKHNARLSGVTQLTVEQLEARCLLASPAMVVILELGHGTRGVGSGMWEVEQKILRDQRFAGRVEVVRLDWAYGIFLPFSYGAQYAHNLTIITSHLERYRAHPRPSIVFGGHSEGGDMALRHSVVFAQRGMRPTAFVGWELINPERFPRLDQSADVYDASASGIPGGRIYNAQQRNPNRFANAGLYGYNIAGAYNDDVRYMGSGKRPGALTNSDHTNLDNDRGPGANGLYGDLDDERDLGTHRYAIDFLFSLLPPSESNPPAGAVAEVAQALPKAVDVLFQLTVISASVEAIDVVIKEDWPDALAQRSEEETMFVCTARSFTPSIVSPDSLAVLLVSPVWVVL